ncbi:glycerophosphoinositol inositolphosphodiesterase GDPD2-like isoform X2 [Anneissia japonica]|uniref:glycerophosphoinositol inositolphosphodiesterase GDPD2-like isoform X2 n=1 Tax=Anneissia japonica TaxID=1529436 RepID=UPI00142573C7|nr:glycerophosphoinositol inositolphosphodiesterase GDPD2-like isoform X2 [Anneissia japonica]
MVCCSCVGAVTTRCYSCRKRQRFRRKRKASKCEKVWFVFLVITFIVSLANTFYWFSISNDSNTINKYIWNSFGVWFPIYFVLLVMTCILFGYIALLLLFGIISICLQEDLRLHLIHKVLTCLVFVSNITILVLATVLDPGLWILVSRYLQFSGPFLHLIAVVFVTIVTWFVAAGLGVLCDRGVTVRDITLIYFVLIIGLYIAPIFIKSPCIMDYNELPEKPLIFAHKGAEMVAPENTDIAFRLALDEYGAHGIESDVRISRDGVPYVMHDELLRRTTNVKDIFPNRYVEPADNFTIKELKELNAGSWFMEKDPFMTARLLSAEQKVQYRSQKIPTMQEMFSIARQRNRTLLFDIRPPPAGHPFTESWLNVTLDAVRAEGIANKDLVFWKAPNGPHYVVFINTFDKRKIQNVHHSIPFKYIISNATMNISTNVWNVKEKWLFSLFWCVGTSSITTSACHSLQELDAPSWQLSRQHYLIMWILFDIASVVWVVVLFIIQISRNRQSSAVKSDRYKYTDFIALEEMTSNTASTTVNSTHVSETAASKT